MDYTSLLHLLSTLSTLSWNIPSDSVNDTIHVPICSNTTKSFNEDFYIYHDDFSQTSLKQYNCSCHIVYHGNKSRIELQHFTFINKKNTTLHLHYDSNNTEDFRAKSIYNCSKKPNKCYIKIKENGTIHFTENGGISQFLFKIKGDSNISLSCNQNSSEITHPDIAENKEDNYTLYDQLPLLNSNDNINHGISVYVGWALTGIGSLMLFIAALTIFIFLRKYRQKKEVSDKVSNTQTVTEIISEKTDIQSAKVSESKPCEEDYEFCEINEYYTICKDKATSPYTAPNLPSKPPPIKQNSVDLIDSSVTVGRNSQTETNQGTSAQTESYSNHQLDLKSVTTNQGEKTNQKIVNSNHSVDGKSGNLSVSLQTGQSDYDNVDDFEDTYNHLDDVFSPLSLNSSSTDNTLNKNSILDQDTIGSTSEKGDISTGIETKSNNQADTDVQIVTLDSQNKSETRKHGVSDHTGHESVNDDVILRTAGSCSIRSQSDTKLLNKSDTSDFDKVVCELVQRSKSCNSTIDTEQPKMIIIENDLYESVDG